jgi:hypothetical protein
MSRSFAKNRGNAVLGAIELTEEGLHCTGPVTLPRHPGLRIDRPTNDSYRLALDHPGDRPLYYRVEAGRLRWAEDPAALLTAGPAAPDGGMLLAMINGTFPDPTSTLLPGIQRLAAGDTVLVDDSGVTVTHQQTTPPGDGSSLPAAMSRTLGALGGYAIAYSGGLASAFTALCAVQAGHRPLLLRAELDGRTSHAVPDIPGLACERVPVALGELLDYRWITGTELVPPLPDLEVPRRLAGHLGAHTGLPVVVGSFLEDLASARLPDVGTGTRGWRLLTCEPFHVTGTMATLREAREFVRNSGAPAEPDGGPESPPEGHEAGPPPGAPDTGFLPGLTDTGLEACASAQRGMLAQWKARLDLVLPIVGHVEAALAERGTAGAMVPALEPAVLGAAAALPTASLGRLRNGMFENHRPLHRLLARHGVTGVLHRPPGFWLRRAAADYLRRQRAVVADQLRRDCVLADLGLVDPEVVVGLLDRGPDFGARALPLLRLIWVDQWLRGRS